MAKIIKFPSPEKSRKKQQERKLFFIDYEPSENCCNTESYRQVCVKCEKCGRRFVGGVLQKEGEG